MPLFFFLSFFLFASLTKGINDSMVLVAVYLLIIAHPGPVFRGFDDENALEQGTAGADLEKERETA